MKKSENISSHKFFVKVMPIDMLYDYKFKLYSAYIWIPDEYFTLNSDETAFMIKKGSYEEDAFMQHIQWTYVEDYVSRPLDDIEFVNVYFRLSARNRKKTAQCSRQIHHYYGVIKQGTLTIFYNRDIFDKEKENILSTPISNNSKILEKLSYIEKRV